MPKGNHLKRKRSILLLFILLCLLQPVVVNATSDRTITPAQWQQLTNDKAFGYVNDVEHIQPPQQLEPGIFQKLVMSLVSFFTGSGGAILFWMLVIGVVIYILAKVVLNKDSFLFSRGKKKMSPDEALQEDEDIATTNWEALRQQAMNNNDLRMAVRYSYMWLLQMLQQRELIQYRIDKTNYEYASELNDTDYKQPFKQLSRQYEYAWYGQFAPSEVAYKAYTDLFDNVKKQLGA
jgi:hypothetical protein